MEFKTQEEREELEKHLSEQTGNTVKIMDINDTFDFKCQRCGQCCMGRTDIVLSPFDIYNASIALNITPIEFIVNYTNTHIGRNSKLPVITLKPDKKNWCPFLQLDIKNGGLFKCSINDNKPGACRNHPIGVVTSFKKDENGIEDEMSEIYIKVEQCENSKGHNNPNLVSEWMQKGEELKEERKWSHKIQSLPSLKLNLHRFYSLLTCVANGPDNIDDYDAEEKERIQSVMNSSVEIMKFLFTSISELTYGLYDTNEPFVEQVKENYAKLEEVLDNVAKYYNEIEKSYVASGSSLEDLDNIE